VESAGAMLEVKGPRLYFLTALLKAEPNALTLVFLMPGGMDLSFNILCCVAASPAAVSRVESLVIRSLYSFFKFPIWLGGIMRT